MQRAPEWTEARRIFRSLMETSGLLGWICEEDGYCIYLSSAWHEATGSTEGSGVEWLNSIHPDDRCKTMKAFTDANFQQSEYSVEYRLEQVNGGYLPAIARGAPHFSADGQYLGMVGVTKTLNAVTSAVNLVAPPTQTPKSMTLSLREREVLQLVARGYTDETVAVQLGIAVSTVSKHVRTATHKLQTSTRTHTVVRAISLNELELPVVDA